MNHDYQYNIIILFIRYDDFYSSTTHFTWVHTQSRHPTISRSNIIVVKLQRTYNNDGNNFLWRYYYDTKTLKFYLKTTEGVYHKCRFDIAIVYKVVEESGLLKLDTQSYTVIIIIKARISMLRNKFWNFFIFCKLQMCFKQVVYYSNHDFLFAYSKGGH